ncbi:MAG: ATP-binding cassette domain-containing protein [Bifidobacteriaceae bacterium]|nr:ATP-binding cassette domain-containing protein [Bifidobacteriaceae bacterium]
MSPFNPANPANPADHNPTHRSAPRGVVSVSDLSFSWPDGEPVFDSLSFAVSRGASGLVGAGGSGKSTLLRLLAGQLTPTRGSIHIAGKVAYLPQNVTLAPARSVEDVLGVSQIREALRQIEAGSTQEAVYGIVGENWDIEERTMAALASVGLPDLDLDRAVGSLSGGEATALALGGCLLRGAQVLLLDEPTNNLDRAGRLRVRRVVEGWRGGALVVVSHDRELLEAVERIGELRGGALTWYGGGWSGYRAAVEAEQAAALATLRTARATEKRQARERSEAEAKLAARRRSGAAAQARNRYPKIIAEQRKRDAQVSAGKLRAVHAERLAQARDDVESAKSSLRADPAVAIDLPATAVPPAAQCWS